MTDDFETAKHHVGYSHCEAKELGKDWLSEHPYERCAGCQALTRIEAERDRLRERVNALEVARSRLWGAAQWAVVEAGWSLEQFNDLTMRRYDAVTGANADSTPGKKV